MRALLSRRILVICPFWMQFTISRCLSDYCTKLAEAYCAYSMHFRARRVEGVKFMLVIGADLIFSTRAPLIQARIIWVLG